MERYECTPYHLSRDYGKTGTGRFNKCFCRLRTGSTCFYFSRAIDDRSGIAKHESLHNVEFINQKFKDDRYNIRSTKLVGCIWIKDGCKLPSQDGSKKVEIRNDGVHAGEVDITKHLSLGGEQNYGFGSLKLESLNKEVRIIPVDDNLEGEEVIVNIKNGNPVLSHVSFDEKVLFYGDIELLSGREYPTKGNKRFEKAGSKIVSPDYYFSPGTVILQKNKYEGIYVLNWDGAMRIYTG